MYIFFATDLPIGEIDSIVYSVFEAKSDDAAKEKVDSLKTQTKEKFGVVPTHWSLFRAEVIEKGEHDRGARALPLYPAIAEG
ncbi:MAG: hypothetical protein WCW78_03380 [Candidatus Paceibacterota bacterium]|jgi:hypothetical protein